MYKFLIITIKRKFLFFWLNKEIFVDLWNGEEIPEINNKVIKVKFSWAMGTPLFPNGEGHYGKTRVSTETTNGQQILCAFGVNVKDVMKAADMLKTKKLPEDWQKRPAYRTISRPVVNCNCGGDEDCVRDSFDFLC